MQSRRGTRNPLQFDTLPTCFYTLDGVGPSGDPFSLHGVSRTRVFLTWLRRFGSQREKASQRQLELMVGV